MLYKVHGIIRSVPYDPLGDQQILEFFETRHIFVMRELDLEGLQNLIFETGVIYVIMDRCTDIKLLKAPAGKQITQNSVSTSSKTFCGRSAFGKTENFYIFEATQKCLLICMKFAL
jgi:hypothetical protein